MGDRSAIEWTDSSWNPVSGCTKISLGCRNCYAERMAKRLKAMGVRRYRNGFAVTLQPDLLPLPLKWNRPRRIFVNSMSDLFHDKVPIDYIRQVFNVMRRASGHTFQILTKRAERLGKIAPQLEWPPNVWIGVTVEAPQYLHRVEILRTVPAAVRFISAEPLLAPLGHFDLRSIDWLIVGGESGPGARPISEEWVRDLRDMCLKHQVPFFFKQWGGVNKKKAGRRLDRRIWSNMPILQPAT